MNDALPESSANAIDIRNLNYAYANTDTPALQGINLSIKLHSVLGLLGPNGAGKTTLISLLSGILGVPEGVGISVLGFNLPQERKKIRSLSALVPQDYAFYPALSGRENLQHFSILYGQSAIVAKERIDYCVHVCGLQAVLDRRSSQYSGGVKRRLNLAIGLLNKPKVLYLDEPTVGIDAQSRNFILQAIKELKKEGITIVYTSHYMEEVQVICDDVAIIDHGRVIANDSMTGLLGEVEKTPLLIDLEQPLSKQQQTTLQNQHCFIVTDQRLSVNVNDDTALLISLLTQLKAQGISVSRLHSVSNKLEQTYLSLTNQNLRD